ncbi:hypothetical protein PRZ48_010983 [Zasmidium cellare]|uniref:Uncharacterized protein n=1 Tax=Zasmidium cellare TaxID=395010 RepID=A0ABR0EAQ1_ZASCE|nr:hypothetical protein PRZ48_010983 [Zasmidium cellare]
MATSEHKSVQDDRLHLLGLPAEIRNLIWFEVLVTSEKMVITPDNHAAPSLLRVNRQNREEARPIYYLENSFFIHCLDFDPAALLAFRQQSKDLIPRTSKTKKPFKIAVRRATGPEPGNRTNLLKWAKAVHQDQHVPSFKTKHTQPYRAAHAVLEMAYELRNVPWYQVERVISMALYEFDGKVRWR